VRIIVILLTYRDRTGELFRRILSTVLTFFFFFFLPLLIS
jgi:hypothetical protein